MGELMTAKSLTPPAPVIPAAAGTPIPVQQQGFNLNMSDIKELVGLVSDGMKQFKEIMELRNKMQPPPLDTAPQGNNAQRIEGVPPPPPQNTQPQIVKVTNMKIDRAKLKALLNDIILNQATKLPAEIQEKKIGDMIGPNFASFTYNYHGIATLDANFLMDKIVEQFGDAIDTMLTEGK